MPSPIDIDRLKCKTFHPLPFALSQTKPHLMIFICFILGNKNKKTSRIIVDVIKESNVNFVAGEGTMDGKPNWEKSKLRLVKSSGGYLLEFFSPPKVKHIGMIVLYLAQNCVKILERCHVSCPPYMRSPQTDRVNQKVQRTYIIKKF
jgi:hypothetical protein